MELLEFGHACARVVAFPTSGSSFHEWEDRGLVDCLRVALERGWFHLVTVASVDRKAGTPVGNIRGCVWRQDQYDRYIADEVLPFTRWKNPHPYAIVVGASFGGYHALDFGLRHPDLVNRILALSSLVDIRRFTDGFHDDLTDGHNPLEFIPNEHDPGRLERLRSLDIIMAVVKTRTACFMPTASFPRSSGKKGSATPCANGTGFAHDWPVWQRMLPMYLGGES